MQTLQELLREFSYSCPLYFKSYSFRSHNFNRISFLYIFTSCKGIMDLLIDHHFATWTKYGICNANLTDHRFTMNTYRVSFLTFLRIVQGDMLKGSRL